MPPAELAQSTAAFGPAPRILAESLIHRGQLALLELGEARAHAATTAAVAALACALGLLAGFAATLAVAALVWERGDRAAILGLVALAYLLGTGVFAWWAASRFLSWNPMSESRSQIREDCACIVQCLPSTAR